MTGSATDELIRAANEWDRAMVQNDAVEIGRHMADAWVKVGSNGAVCDKHTFLDLIRSRTLSHDVMESHDMSIRVHSDTTAVLTARGVSGGQYQGQVFREVERDSCVFVKQHGSWLCVLTHHSRMAEDKRR